MEHELIKLGALWKKKDKNGKTYLAGNINNTMSIMLFQNKKEKETHPDYVLYVCKRDPPQKKDSVDPATGEIQEDQLA